MDMAYGYSKSYHALSPPIRVGDHLSSKSCNISSAIGVDTEYSKFKVHDVVNKKPLYVEKVSQNSHSLECLSLVTPNMAEHFLVSQILQGMHETLNNPILMLTSFMVGPEGFEPPTQ